MDLNKKLLSNFLFLIMVLALLIVATSYVIGLPPPSSTCYIEFRDMMDDEIINNGNVSLNDYVRIGFSTEAVCDVYRTANLDILLKKKSDNSVVKTLKDKDIFQFNKSESYILDTTPIAGVDLFRSSINVLKKEQDSLFEGIEIISPECGYSTQFSGQITIDIEVKFKDADDYISGWVYANNSQGQIELSHDINNSDSFIQTIPYTINHPGEISLNFEVIDQRGNTKKQRTNIIVYDSTPRNYIAACINPKLDDSFSDSMAIIDGSNSVGVYFPLGGTDLQSIPSSNLIFNWFFSDGMKITKRKNLGGDIVYKKFDINDIGKDFWVQLDLTTDYVNSIPPL